MKIKSTPQAIQNESFYCARWEIKLKISFGILFNLQLVQNKTGMPFKMSQNCQLLRTNIFVINFK